MVRLTLDDVVLEVRRVVVGRDLPRAFQWAACGLAARLGLPVARPDAAPRPGDYWLGCSPDAGWGDADPAVVGWVGPLDIETGLARLRAEAAGRVALAS